MMFFLVKVDMFILYSFCFYIVCKIVKKKRMIKFVWLEWIIIRYWMIYMYVVDVFFFFYIEWVY